MRGSRYPTTRSTSMFAMTNMTPATITTATIGVRSLLSIAFRPYFENPGQMKMVSIRHALAIWAEVSWGQIVLVGMSEGFIRYLNVIVLSGRPHEASEGLQCWC